MPKHKEFGFQRSPRPEQPDQAAPDQSAKIAHRSDYRPIRGCQSAVLGLRYGHPSRRRGKDAESSCKSGPVHTRGAGRGRRGGQCPNSLRVARLANEAASSPRNATATAAASAASARSAGTATSGAASAASATSATSLGILLAGCSGVFFVEDVERPQADVSDFFLIEGQLGREDLQRRYIRRRHGGCGGCARR